MADLIDDHIRVGNFLADDIGSLLGEVVGFEVGFEGGEVVGAGGFLVLGVVEGFVGGEEGLDEEGAPWVGEMRGRGEEGGGEAHSRWRCHTLHPPSTSPLPSSHRTCPTAAQSVLGWHNSASGSCH